MIQDFSQGYYCTSMDIQTYDDGPAIARPLHRFIQSHLFTKESRVIMRVGLDSGPTFDVKPESAIPDDVLGMPRELIDNQGEEDIFILKPEYVDIVGQYNG